MTIPSKLMLVKYLHYLNSSAWLYALPRFTHYAFIHWRTKEMTTTTTTTKMQTAILPGERVLAGLRIAFFGHL